MFPMPHFCSMSCSSVYGSICPEGEIGECVLKLFNGGNQLLTLILSERQHFTFFTTVNPTSSYSDADGLTVSITKLSNLSMSSLTKGVFGEDKNTKNRLQLHLDYKIMSNLKQFLFCMSRGWRASRVKSRIPNATAKTAKQFISYIKF